MVSERRPGVLFPLFLGDLRVVKLDQVGQGHHHKLPIELVQRDRVVRQPQHLQLGTPSQASYFKKVTNLILS